MYSCGDKLKLGRSDVNAPPVLCDVQIWTKEEHSVNTAFRLGLKRWASPSLLKKSSKDIHSLPARGRMCLECEALQLKNPHWFVSSPLLLDGCPPPQRVPPRTPKSAKITTSGCGLTWHLRPTQIGSFFILHQTKATYLHFVKMRNLFLQREKHNVKGKLVHNFTEVDHFLFHFIQHTGCVPWKECQSDKHFFGFTITVISPSQFGATSAVCESFARNMLLQITHPLPTLLLNFQELFGPVCFLKVAFDNSEIRRKNEHFTWLITFHRISLEDQKRFYWHKSLFFALRQ